MKNKPSIRYIVELVVTLLLLMVITLVLVRMFVHSKNQSDYAKDLTGAVNVAQNMAELSAASEDTPDFLDLLSQSDRVSDISEKGDEITLLYAAENRDYQVKVIRDTKDGLTETGIEVFLTGKTDPIYTLDAGSYRQEVDHR